MAFTYVGTTSGSFNASAATMDLAYTATAGSLLVAWAKWEGANGATLGVARNDASEAWQVGTVTDHSNNDLHAGFAYLLSCSGGAATYRMTLSAARAYRSFMIFEYSYSGTASLDQVNGGTGSSTSPSSGNITTTGTDELVVGGYGEYTTTTSSNHQINGTAADGALTTGGSTANLKTAMWRKVFTSTFTGAATCTSGNSAWICRVISFKTAAGGGSTVPKFTNYYRMMRAA